MNKILLKLGAVLTVATFLTALASSLSAEIVVKIAMVDPATQQFVSTPVIYQGPCPVTFKFSAKIMSTSTAQVQYRFVRSDNARTPVSTATLEAGKALVVENTWTLGRDITGWMEIEVTSPEAARSNRAEFKIVCGSGQTATPAVAVKRPVVTGVPVQPQAQPPTTPARPVVKAIPKDKSGTGTETGTSGRPVVKAQPKPDGTPGPRIIGVFFVASGSDNGHISIYDKNGAKIYSFPVAYSDTDKLGVGDVNGDGVDEIAIAGHTNGRVRLFSQAGELIDWFDGNYGKDCGFALGDINGDSKDEIIVADNRNGQITAFTAQKTVLRSFNGNFTKNDAFGAGDMNNDGIDEMLIHNDQTGMITVYDKAGGKVVSFSTLIKTDSGAPVTSGIGSGDLNRDGIGEIIIAFEMGEVGAIMKTDFDPQIISVRDALGRAVKSWSGDFTMSDKLAVGDINGDGASEIAVARDDSRAVNVFNGEGRQIMTFNVDYGKNEGFAVARHR